MDKVDDGKTCCCEGASPVRARAMDVWQPAGSRERRHVVYVGLCLGSVVWHHYGSEKLIYTPFAEWILGVEQEGARRLPKARVVVSGEVVPVDCPTCNRAWTMARNAMARDAQ